MIVLLKIIMLWLLQDLPRLSWEYLGTEHSYFTFRCTVNRFDGAWQLKIHKASHCQGVVEGQTWRPE